MRMRLRSRRDARAVVTAALAGYVFAAHRVVYDNCSAAVVGSESNHSGLPSWAELSSRADIKAQSSDHRFQSHWR